MWGYGSYKRQRRGYNLRRCQECEETEIDTNGGDDEWDVCGQCQRVMCSDCCGSLCSVCEKDGCDGYTVGAVCCEMCMEHCNDCGYDIYFHGDCKARHLANCNAKSRAQRAASSASQKVTDTENQLQQAKVQLARMQSRVKDLEFQLKEARKEKAKADKQLEEQELKPASKTTDLKAK